MLSVLQKDPVIEQIQRLSDREDSDYWSFRGNSKRIGAHALLQYPAMMVPSLQGTLLDAIQAAAPQTKTVLDPFVGSGTILVESMNRGLQFTGFDVNPLAVLACLSKSGPYYADAFAAKCNELKSRIESDRCRRMYVSFEKRDKWFSTTVAYSLSRIARNVEREPALWARRIFWVAFARVARSVSNSRQSTYKLHIKSKDCLSATSSPLTLFADTLDLFVGCLDDQRELWRGRALVRAGRYVERVDVRLGDSNAFLPTMQRASFDVVMTSPPYGDNATTIPYGQFAYLPLKWIPLADIDKTASASLLKNAHAVDSISLGGSKRDAFDRGLALAEKYCSARLFKKKIAGNTDGWKRFGAFFSDLSTCVDEICRVTKDGGYHSWTVGNRRIGGVSVPMEALLMEMLDSRDLAAVASIKRSIPSKRMAPRNNVSETMSAETILLARKRSTAS